jgi:succinate dehydrogenase / fumarate reductase flavoprotein subunit
VSVHGANRLGGNSLLETIVFGRRAGQRAGLYIAGVAPKAPPESLLRDEEARIAKLLARPGRERSWRIREELGQTMAHNLGIFRTEASLKEAAEKVRELRERAGRIELQDRGRVFNSELIQALELHSLLDVAETIVAGALARRESRGAHYRSDFPARDDANWLRHSLAHRTPDGPRLSSAPVTITRWPPK